MSDSDQRPRGRVLHLAPGRQWQQAEREGSYRGSTRGLTLAEVGFVHAATSEQLPVVVETVYAGESLEDHVLLVVDVQACERAGSPVRWEAPALGEPLFPHVYGPLAAEAVVAVLAMEHRPDGSPALPDLDGLDVITSPPTADHGVVKAIVSNPLNG